jgi:Asp-tRNA(Asn)/Glu-tRNA(Gln) amidotransferase A subunit family amidase
VGWGSDTCGSIRIPAAVHNLFGLRPTKGLSSIDGILPLSHSQDTGGPLARTVTDLAIALDATVGPDAADPATAVLEGRPTPDFQAALDPAALAGARIGVLADWLEEGGGGGRITEVVRAALAEMDSLGAEVVDVTIPGLDSLLANTGLIDLEFKFDLMDYLAGVPDAPVSTLEEIVEAGLHHEALDGTFRRRIARTERPTDEYEEAMARRRALRDAVVGFMDAEELDALAYPTMRQETALIGAAPVGSTCSLSANTGLPALTVPAGFTETEVPAGLELLGRALDDARLVAFAYALEAASPKRRAPLRTPPLERGRPPDPVLVALDPPRGSVEGAFLLDLPTGTLSYRVTLAGVEPEDALGVVLRRIPAADGEGGGVVVLRLAGPDVTGVTRSVPLTTRLMHDLLDGRLELVAHTSAGFEHRRLVAGRP